MSSSTGGPSPASWWRRAVTYQVYLRSFADANGDGTGDIPGVISRLRYLADLGVTALWITPWYRSPMADGGYDTADYRDIDPRFGTLPDAERLIGEAHALGLRVIVDIVPNHTSDEHVWFREALSSPPGSAARERYIFRDGRGPDGSLPPNNWRAGFGGSAWTRTAGADGMPGQWYLHLFAPEQPDLNWEHADVRADFLDTLRFWFDRGVDGLRIDVGMSLAKRVGLPDLVESDWVDSPVGRVAGQAHPYFDVEPVHEVWRAWRAVADTYDPPRVFVGELQAIPMERVVRYLAPDELHAAFNFDFLKTAWRAPDLRATIRRTMASLGPAGAPPTWVLSNHDEPRHLTRYGWPDTAYRDPALPLQGEPDLALGRRRARAAALLMLALPGGAYIYQGEELGLPQVLDLPDEALQDPTWERSGRTIRGRDGCRVPLPWSGEARPFGFGPSGSRPWLPQPRSWASLTAEAQAVDPASMLLLYRAALAFRGSHPGLAGDGFRWVEDDRPEVLHFERDAGFRCLVNFGPEPVAVPTGAACLLRSDGPSARGPLPQDAAAWYLAR